MDFYNISDEDKAKIRSMFNVSDEDVQAQMRTLKEWAHSRPQFANYSQDEHFLYVMLVKCKFKEKVAKTYLEKYFKGITKHAKMFQNLGKFKPSEEIAMAVPYPKLTRNFERVIILKFLPQNMTIKPFEVRQLLLIAVTTGMMGYNFDNAASTRFLIDLKDFTTMDLFRINLGVAEIFRVLSICQNMLKLRISGFELINSSKLVYGVLAIARMVIKTKLFLRITVHDDITSLSKNIPMENLPSDYGGECESTEEMLEKWDQIVAAAKRQSIFETIASWSQVNNFNETNGT